MGRIAVGLVLVLVLGLVAFGVLALRDAHAQLQAARAELEHVRAHCAPQAATSPATSPATVKRLQLPSGRVAVMQSTGPGEMSVRFED